MVNFIITVVVGLIVGCAAGYIYRSKKRGAKCIGCPDGGSCSCNCTGKSCCGGQCKG